MSAYAVRAVQVVGPVSIDRDRYDIQARVPLNTSLEELCSMLQALLRERLALVTHQEARTFDVYKLSVAGGGTKLVDSSRRATDSLPRRDANGLPVPLRGGSALNVDLGYARFRATQLSIRQLADGLELWLETPVVDESGLSGRYTYELDFSIVGLGGVFQVHQNDASGGVNIFKALEQQLGLKLERAKEGLPVIVIDSMRKVPVEE